MISRKMTNILCGNVFILVSFSKAEIAQAEVDRVISAFWNSLVQINSKLNPKLHDCLQLKQPHQRTKL